jgi:hypothetical protein
LPRQLSSLELETVLTRQQQQQQQTAGEGGAGAPAADEACAALAGSVPASAPHLGRSGSSVASSLGRVFGLFGGSNGATAASPAPARVHTLAPASSGMPIVRSSAALSRIVAGSDAGVGVTLLSDAEDPDAAAGPRGTSVGLSTAARSPALGGRPVRASASARALYGMLPDTESVAQTSAAQEPLGYQRQQLSVRRRGGPKTPTPVAAALAAQRTGEDEEDVYAYGVDT